MMSQNESFDRRRSPADPMLTSADTLTVDLTYADIKLKRTAKNADAHTTWH